MNWLSKSRASAAPAAVPMARTGPSGPVSAERNVRLSNGLKEFLWLLSDVKHGRLLDMGPVWQATVGFFVERGFRVYTEDLLRCWTEYRGVEEERLRNTPAGEEPKPVPPSVLAERFMELALGYPPENFHAVLAWDIFDYLDGDLMSRVISRLHDILRPGGAILAIFHSRPAERFHRYRVMDAQSVELLPVPSVVPQDRVFQNREILSRFGQFRSSKTFVGRDQLREGLFLK
jgi:hypothetical protein